MTPPDPPPEVTVCALLFGDYPQLAAACLGPLARLWVKGLIDLRVGLNCVSPATRDVLTHLFPADPGRPPPVYVERSAPPAYKYPAMRRLFAAAPLAPFTMWFDDDSRVTDPRVETWLEARLRAARQPGFGMAGQVFRMTCGLQGTQPVWVRTRPWYRGKPVARGLRTPFATGGWWLIRSDILRAHDWPDPDLTHNGGDVMLGELCRQNDYPVLAVDPAAAGLVINGAQRRGASLPPVGMTLKPTPGGES